MRYPLEPLATAAHITLGQPGRPDRSTGTTGGDPLAGLTLLAAQLDVSVSTVKRARRAGLDIDQADRWALALGTMPHDVWGQAWWDSVLTDDELQEQASHRRRLQWRHRTRTTLRCRHTSPQPLPAAA